MGFAAARLNGPLKRAGRRDEVSLRQGGEVASMDNNNAAIYGFMATFYVFFAVVIIAMCVFSIWLYWRVFQRAGFNGALALLNLVPVGSLICMIILAFGRWPIEDQLAAMQGHQVAPPPGPPPAPPGSSVMTT
jgi:hypothetical protein